MSMTETFTAKNIPNREQTQNILNEISNHVDLKLGSFVIPIIMYILSFPYILNNKTSEYIAWILISFLNIVFPFTFMKELFVLSSKHMKSNGTSGKIMAFSVFSIFITYLLQFIVLIFVLLKNESIRKGKVKRGEYDNEGKQNLDTKERSVERRDRIISILFITGSVLTWAMTGNHFGYDLRTSMFEEKPSGEKGEDTTKFLSPEEKMKNMFPIGSKVHWLIHLMPGILRTLDGYLHSSIDWIPLDSLTKGFFIYCVAFIVILFSFFIRIKYAYQKERVVESDGSIRYEKRLVQRKGHKVVNVSHLFGKTFYSQIKHIRRVCIVSLVFLIIMIGIILFMTFYMSPRGYSLSTPLFSNEYVQTPMHIIMIWCVLMIVILFPAFFAEKKERIGEQQKKDNRFRDDDEGEKKSTNKLKQAIFPLDEKNVYYKKEIDTSTFNSIKDTSIKVYYGKNDLLEGNVSINKTSTDKSISQVIAELGYYFETYLFPNSNFDVVVQSDNVRIADTGIRVNITNAWNLVEKKYKNLNAFDIDISPDKEKDYDAFKKEFRSIMEQIYAQNHSVFSVDRAEYDRSNTIIEKPFVYEDTEEYKSKLIEYEQKRYNQPLKRYIFFLVCLFFGFIGSPVILALIEFGLRFTNGSFHNFKKFGFTFWYFVVSCIMTLIMFLIGVDKPSLKNNGNDGNNFLRPHNSNKMKTFLAILWSMAGASFFALSTKFNMFSAMWSGPGTLISILLKTVGPLAIMLFAALSLFYAFKNYKRYKYSTSG